MFLSGLLPRQMTAEDDKKLLEHGIGFTNIVERTTKGSANLTRREIEEGNEVIYILILSIEAKLLELQNILIINNTKFIFRKRCAYSKNPAISTKGRSV